MHFTNCIGEGCGEWHSGSMPRAQPGRPGCTNEPGCTSASNMRPIAKSFDPGSIWPTWTKMNERASGTAQRPGLSSQRRMPEDRTELGELGKDGKLGGYKGDANLRRLRPPVYGFGASGQRPYQSNG